MQIYGLDLIFNLSIIDDSPENNAQGTHFRGILNYLHISTKINNLIDYGIHGLSVGCS